MFYRTTNSICRRLYSSIPTAKNGFLSRKRILRCFYVQQEINFFYGRATVSYGSKPSGGESSKKPVSNEKPTWEHLQHICLRLSETAPKFFDVQIDYTFYREDVVFVDNITNHTTRGLTSYRWRMQSLSGFLRFIYPFCELQVLNITPMIDEGTVRLRWRVLHKTWLDVFASFLQFKYSRLEMRKDARWFDGYSTFYVGSDGLVFKHIVDRITPDETKTTVKRPRVSFLARLLGTATAKSTMARVRRS